MIDRIRELIVLGCCIGLLLQTPGASEDAPRPEAKSPTETYRFFVAGHVYGTPSVDVVGVHPPFQRELDALMGSETPAQFGVLTGDVVWLPTPENWKEIDDVIEKLGIDIHIAPGNHDKRRNVFEYRPDKSYYAFDYNSDLFIILNNDTSDWSVRGDQLDYLKSVITQAGSHRNIFVFMHQLAWWEPDNEFHCAKINSRTGRTGASNFHTELMPLFRGVENDVFVFAGDTGAFLDRDPMYHRDGNVRLISSGMGGGNGNFLIIDVSEYVDINLKWLNRVDDSTLSQAVRNKISTNKMLIEDYQINCDQPGEGKANLNWGDLIATIKNVVTEEERIRAAKETLSLARAGTAIPTNSVDTEYENNVEIYYTPELISVVVPDCNNQKELASLNLTAHKMRAVTHDERMIGPLSENLKPVLLRRGAYVTHEETPYCVATAPIKTNNIWKLSGSRAIEAESEWRLDYAFMSRQSYLEASRSTEDKLAPANSIICDTATLLCFKNTEATEYAGEFRDGVVQAKDGKRIKEFYLRSKLTLSELEENYPDKEFRALRPVGSIPGYFIRKYKDDNTIIMTTQDEAVAALTDTDLSNMLKYGLDLRRLEFRGAHVAIFSPGEEIINQTDNSKAVVFNKEDHGLSNIGTIASALWGSASSIFYKGIDVSPKQRGLNFVVIDRMGNVIRKVNYDTHRSPYRSEGLYLVSTPDVAGH